MVCCSVQLLDLAAAGTEALRAHLCSVGLLLLLDVARASSRYVSCFEGGLFGVGNQENPKGSHHCFWDSVPKKTDLQIVGVGGPFLLPRVSASVPPPTPASVDNIDFQHLSKLARFVLTFDIFTQ